MLILHCWYAGFVSLFVGFFFVFLNKLWFDSLICCLEFYTHSWHKNLRKTEIWLSFQPTFLHSNQSISCIQLCIFVFWKTCYLIHWLCNSMHLKIFCAAWSHRKGNEHLPHCHRLDLIWDLCSCSWPRNKSFIGPVFLLDSCGEMREKLWLGPESQIELNVFPCCGPDLRRSLMNTF